MTMNPGIYDKTFLRDFILQERYIPTDIYFMKKSLVDLEGATS